MFTTLFALVAFTSNSYSAELCNKVSPSFPIQQDIIMNVLIKGPKGCLQQGKFTFPHINFFKNDAQFSQTFELKNPDTKKVLGHYRSEIQVTQLEEDRSRFKIAIGTFDIDQKPEKLVDVSISFLSSGRCFAQVTRWESPDPKLGFAEVAIADSEFMERTKVLTRPNQTTF